MSIVGRTLRLFALVLWVGSVLFFGAVLAPVAFQVLPSPHLAGLVVGASLHRLHTIGIGCGVVMLVALRLLGARALKPLAQVLLVAAMLTLTLVSNRFVLEPMDRDQELAAGQISILLPGSPLREDFDARHRWSTRLEGGVLLCGVALGLLMAFESGASAKKSS